MSTSPAPSSYDIAHAQRVQPLAHRLSYAGLAPFVVGAVLSLLGLQDDAHYFVLLALSAYAAIVVSFLGGVHWGVAMSQSVTAVDAAGPRSFGWGVLPSILAWAAVVMPAYAGLVILGLLLVACYLVDRRLYPAYGMANWLTLRFRLTVVAVLCCFLAAAAT